MNRHQNHPYAPSRARILRDPSFAPPEIIFSGERVLYPGVLLRRYGSKMNAIAREMGMSGPALFRYFPNRDALLRADRRLPSRNTTLTQTVDPDPFVVREAQPGYSMASKAAR
jgi:hypothetical protein